MKIREQQRLLAGAKVDPNTAKKVGRAAKEVPKTRTPEASRKGKRKAEIKDESEDELGFENHRAAMPGGPHAEETDADDGEEQVDTPDPSDQDVTEDDDDDLGAAGGGEQGGGIHGTSKDEDEKMQVDSLPPSRALPFGKLDVDGGAGREREREIEADRSVLNQEAGNEDAETEDEDDDEL